MTERQSPREWSLVVFTLALQLSCGLVLSTTLCQIEAGAESSAHLRLLGLAAFPIALVGVLASLCHLGRPWSAWKSLRNFPESRLSVEVLLTMLYSVTCAAYSFAWFHGAAQWRLVAGSLASVIGVAAVVASAMIYMVPSQPAWNSKWVLGSFASTMLALGGACTWASLSPSERHIYASPAILAFIGGTLVIASASGMAARLRTLSATGRAQLFTRQQRLILALHVLFAGLLPVGLAAQDWLPAAAMPDAITAPMATAILAAVLAGVLLGRRLLYSLVNESF